MDDSFAIVSPSQVRRHLNTRKFFKIIMEGKKIFRMHPFNKSLNDYRLFQVYLQQFDKNISWKKKLFWSRQKLVVEFFTKI